MKIKLLGTRTKKHMNKFIAKFFSGINNLAFVIIKAITNLFKKLFRIMDALFTFLHDVTELFIRRVIKRIRESNNPILRKIRSESYFYLALFIVLIIIFFNLVMQMFYIVDIGTRATIIRFGAFSRESLPGLHLKIPYIEQVYHVMYGDLLQENIGFVMVPRTELGPKTPMELAAETYAIKQHKLTNSGGIFTEFSRGPKLTKDYLIDRFGGPFLSMRPNVIQKRTVPLLEKQEELMGFPKNGRAGLPHDTQILCGNLNIVEVNWVVQFEIVDAKKYLFNSTNARENLRNASMAAMRQVVGDSLDFEAIATARDRIEAKVLNITQKTLDQLDIGIRVAFNFIVEALPPAQVKDSYDAVSIARQEMESKILEARIKYNSIIPQAKGEAEKIIAEAHAYATIIRNKAEGESERFRLIFEKYSKEKEATWDRMYIEGMQNVFSHGKITLLDPDVKGILPILYNKELTQGGSTVSGAFPGVGTIEEIVSLTNHGPLQVHAQRNVQPQVQTPPNNTRTTTATAPTTPTTTTTHTTAPTSRTVAGGTVATGVGAVPLVP
ncbi:MAG: FtsH protease activity modulator HflK [Oligoflexia bacterium]|nr:FtsH protease activity modulator HflK [Oligoflexia bacterium]